MKVGDKVKMPDEVTPAMSVETQISAGVLMAMAGGMFAISGLGYEGGQHWAKLMGTGYWFPCKWLTVVEDEQSEVARLRAENGRLIEDLAESEETATRLRAENERLRDILKEATDATVSDYAHSIGFQDGSFPTGEPIKIDWLEWTKKSLAALSETAQPAEK